MRRFLYAVALGLVGAGIVHIAILLMLPAYSERDAWSQLSRVTGKYSVVRLGGIPGETPIPVSPNPFIEAAACLFNLDEGVVHITAEGDVPFWSVSIYNRNGLNVFSFNDNAASERAANEKALDLVVLTADQVAGLRNAPTPAFSGSIFVESDSAPGIALVRVFMPDESWEGVVAEFFESMKCDLR